MNLKKTVIIKRKKKKKNLKKPGFFSKIKTGFLNIRIGKRRLGDFALFKRGTKLNKAVRITGRVFASGALVFVIVGSIVTTFVAIYIINNVDTSVITDVNSIKLNYTSMVYYTDKTTGEKKLLDTLYTTENREWVDYGNIPQNIKDAFIAIEDKRFLQHNGVDWRRTVRAFAGFAGIATDTGGGSTITQQLIKNITKDDDETANRKIEEIFRALNMEKKFTKEQILEAYLNTIALSNGLNGVQSASKYYFGVKVDQLNLAQATCLSAITKNPTKFDPTKNLANNRERMIIILDAMLEQGKITKVEYDAALAFELKFQPPSKKEFQTYFVDQMMEEIANDLVLEKKYKINDAKELLFIGGFQIETTVDYEMQMTLEELYKKESTFPKIGSGTQPQSAMVVMGYDGGIQAVVGGRGEKTTERPLNRAYQSKIQPGSTMKPLSVYCPAIELNKANWLTQLSDQQIYNKDLGKYWPENWYKSYSSSISIQTALIRSSNCAPVRLCESMGAQNCYNFITSKLGITTLVENQNVKGKIYSDVNLSALALGGTTNGVTLTEWVGAYQVFGNLGRYNKPHTYTVIKDRDGNQILPAKDRQPSQAIGEDTAYIMNRLLYKVATEYSVNEPARLPNMPILGKTGTTTDYKDYSFVGLTPYNVAYCWLGHDIPKAMPDMSNPAPRLWGNVMKVLMKDFPYADFNMSDKTLAVYYCTATGNRARSGCPKAEGYFKASNAPKACGSHEGEVVPPFKTGKATGNATESSGASIPSTSEPPAPPVSSEASTSTISSAPSEAESSVASSSEVSTPPSKPDPTPSGSDDDDDDDGSLTTP